MYQVLEMGYHDCLHAVCARMLHVLWTVQCHWRTHDLAVTLVIYHTYLDYKTYKTF